MAFSVHFLVGKFFEVFSEVQQCGQRLERLDLACKRQLNSYTVEYLPSIPDLQLNNSSLLSFSGVSGYCLKETVYFLSVNPHSQLILWRRICNVHAFMGGGRILHFISWMWQAYSSCIEELYDSSWHHHHTFSPVISALHSSSLLPILIARLVSMPTSKLRQQNKMEKALSLHFPTMRHPPFDSCSLTSISPMCKVCYWFYWSIVSRLPVVFFVMGWYVRRFRHLLDGFIRQLQRSPLMGGFSTILFTWVFTNFFLFSSFE